MNSQFNNAPPPVMVNSSLNMAKRGPRKRKKNQDSINSSTSKKNKVEIPYKQRLPSHGYPLEHPFNKDGYRYVLAEPDPYIPDTEPETDLAAKPCYAIPSKQYRRWLPEKVLLALHDRASIIKMSEDRLSVTGEKGYAMVRASHYVTEGGWYYEATVIDLPVKSATRIGWSQKLGNLQAPLGYDKFGYSWRSKKGTRFHQSKGKHYGEPYNQGDVLGFYIYLPPSNKPKKLCDTCKENALIKFKTFFYFEVKDDLEAAEKKLKPLAGSFMEFYKNGVSQGKIWLGEVNSGSYYPCISLFKNASVSVNFGPNFKHPPTNNKFKAMSGRAFETIIESSLSDLVYAATLEVDGDR